MDIRILTVVKAYKACIEPKRLRTQYLLSLDDSGSASWNTWVDISAFGDYGYVNYDEAAAQEAASHWDGLNPLGDEYWRFSVVTLVLL